MFLIKKTVLNSKTPAFLIGYLGVMEDNRYIELYADLTGPTLSKFERKRFEIVQAAISIIGKDGIGDLTFRKIGTKLGMSPQTLPIILNLEMSSSSGVESTR